MTFVMIDGTTSLDFTLDGSYAGTFNFDVTPGLEAFNTTVFSDENLSPDGSHNLTISTMNAVAFDFATYTYVFTVQCLVCYASTCM